MDSFYRFLCNDLLYTTYIRVSISKEPEKICYQKMLQYHFCCLQFKLLLLLVVLVPPASINERPHCQEKEAHLSNLLSCSFPLAVSINIS